MTAEQGKETLPTVHPIIPHARIAAAFLLTVAWGACELCGEDRDAVATPQTHKTTAHDADGPLTFRWKNYCVCRHFDVERNITYSCVHLTGELETPKAARLIAVSSGRDVELTDPQGHNLPPYTPASIHSQTADPTDDEPHEDERGFNRHYLAAYFSGLHNARRVWVHAHVSPELPSRIGRLRGRVNVLLATETVEKQFPVGNLADYTEVAPNLEMKMEKMGVATASQGLRHETWRIRVRRRSQNSPKESPPLTQPPLVLGVYFLDQQSQGLGRRARSDGGPGESAGWQYSTFTCEVSLGAEQSLQAVRLVLLTGAKLRTIPFDLSDLPAGELFDQTPEAETSKEKLSEQPPSPAL